MLILEKNELGIFRYAVKNVEDYTKIDEKPTTENEKFSMSYYKNDFVIRAKDTCLGQMELLYFQIFLYNTNKYAEIATLEPGTSHVDQIINVYLVFVFGNMI